MHNLPVAVDISGFTLSGKSSVTQILKEFNRAQVPDVEFEFGLFRMKDGLFDLEHAIVDDWSPVRSDAAIRRFIRLVDILGNGYKRYGFRWLSSPSGYNYDHLINKGFIKISSQYIESLINQKNICYWPFSLHDISGVDCFVRRVKSVFAGDKRDFDSRFIVFGDDFYEKTSAYLSSLLFERSECDYYVFHNAFEPYRASDVNKFFDGGKSIIVDRDPRAIYANSKRSRYSGFSSVEEFILNFRVTRDKCANRFFDSSVLNLRFEEVVLNYDQVLVEIYKFLGASEEVHINKGKFFDPSRSKLNLSSWKKELETFEIDAIQKNLMEYCFE